MVRNALERVVLSESQQRYKRWKSTLINSITKVVFFWPSLQEILTKGGLYPLRTGNRTGNPDMKLQLLFHFYNIFIALIQGLTLSSAIFGMLPTAEEPFNYVNMEGSNNDNITADRMLYDASSFNLNDRGIDSEGFT